MHYKYTLGCQGANSDLSSWVWLEGTHHSWSRSGTPSYTMDKSVDQPLKVVIPIANENEVANMLPSCIWNPSPQSFDNWYQIINRHEKRELLCNKIVGNGG